MIPDRFIRVSWLNSGTGFLVVVDNDIVDNYYSCMDPNSLEFKKGVGMFPLITDWVSNCVINMDKYGTVKFKGPGGETFPFIKMSIDSFNEYIVPLHPKYVHISYEQA